MKKTIVLASLLFLAASVSVWAQEKGRVVQDTVKSRILGVEKVYSVYLPAGYDDTAQDYPVLYLLHGAWGDHTSWVEMGNARRIADQTLSSGFARPMIIVMPDASGLGADRGGMWKASSVSVPTSRTEPSPVFRWVGERLRYMRSGIRSISVRLVRSAAWSATLKAAQPCCGTSWPISPNRCAA